MNSIIDLSRHAEISMLSPSPVKESKAAQSLRAEYPLVHFHIISGDKVTVTEDLDRGLLDFGLLFGEIDLSKYDSLKVPAADRFGVLMRQDDPLAAKAPRVCHVKVMSRATFDFSR